MAAYPRLYVSEKTHAKVLKAAKKQKSVKEQTLKAFGEKVAKAGLKALGY